MNWKDPVIWIGIAGGTVSTFILGQFIPLTVFDIVAVLTWNSILKAWALDDYINGKFEMRGNEAEE